MCAAVQGEAESSLVPRRNRLELLDLFAMAGISPARPVSD